LRVTLKIAQQAFNRHFIDTVCWYQRKYAKRWQRARCGHQRSDQ
jgi:hypothetical protein